MGFRRNLTAEEIVGQFELVSLSSGPITNLVFMGMGEPLLNLENVSRAVSWFADDSRLKVPRNRITLSTVGIISGLTTLAEKGPDVNLAVTLFSAFQEIRARYIPLSLEHDLESLKKACKYYQGKRRKRILFSVPLIADVNDSPRDAKAIVGFLDGLDAKVNLIPLNPQMTTGQKAPDIEVVDRFHKIILDSGIPVFTRARKGSDIGAACGQLAGKIKSALC
jgi:23S rRNA (adenine2503-C2)-methyltransferase